MSAAKALFGLLPWCLSGVLFSQGWLQAEALWQLWIMSASSLALLAGMFVRWRRAVASDATTVFMPRRCGQCRQPLECYTVTDAVWAQAGFHKGQFRCLRCLEAALGRALVADDLTNTSCNFVHFRWVFCAHCDDVGVASVAPAYGLAAEAAHRLLPGCPDGSGHAAWQKGAALGWAVGSAFHAAGTREAPVFVSPATGAVLAWAWAGIPCVL